MFYKNRYTEICEIVEYFKYKAEAEILKIIMIIVCFKNCFKSIYVKYMHLFSIKPYKILPFSERKNRTRSTEQNRTSGVFDADNIPAISYARYQSVFNARRLVPKLIRLDPYTTLEHRNVRRNILRIFTRIFSA